MRPGKCLHRIIRIKAVEKEYQVAMIARNILGKEFGDDPSILTGAGLERTHFDDFSDNLGSTYLIRLFAEFEFGLRVHVGGFEAPPVEIGEARKFLCVFFGRLPENW